jgi:hypothetical protein
LVLKVALSRVNGITLSQTVTVGVAGMRTSVAQWTVVSALAMGLNATGATV